jgi:hypothetical protein
MPSKPMTHTCRNATAVDVLDVLIESDASIGVGQELHQQSAAVHPGLVAQIAAVEFQ